MSLKLNERKAVLILLFVSIVWGAGFLAVDIIFRNFSTFQILSGRFLIGAIALSIVFRKEMRDLNLNDIIGGAFVGAILVVAFGFQIYGQYFSTPSINAFVTAIYVVLIPIFQFFIFKKSQKKSIVVSALLTFAGIVLITLGSLNGTGTKVEAINLNLGVVLTFICAICYAFQIIAVEKFTRGKNQISPLKITVIMLWVAAVLAIIISVILVRVNIDNPPLYDDNFWIAVTWTVFLGLFCTAFAFLAQNIAQKHTSASKTAILLSLESVFGAAFSALFLGERFTVLTIVGFVAVFLAVLIAEEVIFKGKVKSVKLNYIQGE